MTSTRAGLKPASLAIWTSYDAALLTGFQVSVGSDDTVVPAFGAVIFGVAGLAAATAGTRSIAAASVGASRRAKRRVMHGASPFRGRP